jgi:thiol-disulfide isomerase/thioredoxin
VTVSIVTTHSSSFFVPFYTTAIILIILIILMNTIMLMKGTNHLWGVSITMCLCVLLLAAASFSTCLAQQTLTVTALTDATFEHQTQASTGSTTGSWLVLFYSTMDVDKEKCPICPAIATQFEQLMTRANSEDDDAIASNSLYDKGIVLGTVNVMTSPQTASRFEIETTPTILYIHRGNYYTVPKSSFWTTTQKMTREDEDTEETAKVQVQHRLDDLLMNRLHDFVMGDYITVDGRAIPAPPSLFLQVEETVKEIFHEYYPYVIVGAMALMVGIANMAVVMKSQKKSFKKD